MSKQNCVSKQRNVISRLPKTIHFDPRIRTEKDFWRIFKEEGIDISFSNFEVVLQRCESDKNKKAEADLVMATTYDLTGKLDDATLDEVFKGAIHHGLKRCPVNVALHYYLQSRKSGYALPYGDKLYITLYPSVYDFFGYVYVYYIKNFEFLNRTVDHDVPAWEKSDIWLFVL